MGAWPEPGSGGWGDGAHPVSVCGTCRGGGQAWVGGGEGLRSQGASPEHRQPRVADEGRPQVVPGS